MRRHLLLLFSFIVLVLLLCFTWHAPAPSIAFLSGYAEVGTPFHVSVSGYPSGTQFSYEWYVGDRLVASGQDYYTPAKEDLEQFIRVVVTPSDSNESLSLSTYFSRLPVFYLNTEEEIPKETYIDGSLTIQGNSLYFQEDQLYSGQIQIHGRGNSTWDSYPKKPYKIKLEKNADLFGMGTNKHWVLFSNYADESLMRNKISYDLSGALGMPYMESTWVSLVLNGTYVGNYLLSEQIRIDEDRVNITDLTKYAKKVAKAFVNAEIFPKSQQDLLELTLEQNLQWLSTGVFVFMDNEYDITPYVTLPELTGGYLLEIDGYFDETSKFLATYQPVMFKNPEFACTNTEIMNYAEEYFTAAFKAMLESEDFYATFQGQEVSYTQLFDIHSLAQYILIQEIFFNYDATLKSNYMYKDTAGMAYMGPIWDMDWSSGRTSGGIRSTQWWSVYYGETADETLWYEGIIRDPYFLSILKEVWDSSYDTIMELTADGGTLEQSYQYIYESAMANSALWLAECGFESSYATFHTWLEERLQWMAPHFVDLETLVSSFDQYHPHKDIDLTLSQDTLVVSSPSGAYAVLYYNGIRISKQSLEQTQASWNLSALAPASASDVLQVRVYDAEGTLIGSNYMDRRS